MPTKQIIEEAIKVVRPKVFGDSEIGMVRCALITDNNTIFKGVCIHTVYGMGFLPNIQRLVRWSQKVNIKYKKL